MLGTPSSVTDCKSCRFWGREGDTAQTCRRYAPRAWDREFQIARWPETRPTDNCGEGTPIDDPGDANPKQQCETCVFWHRPGIGIDPGQRSDRLSVWWQRAGYCRRYAPRPGSAIGEHAFWRATHANDYCFEGRPR